jgi:hypothetical protein
MFTIYEYAKHLLVVLVMASDGQFWLRHVKAKLYIVKFLHFMVPATHNSVELSTTREATRCAATR